jgi:hypothetical protein
VSIHKRFTRLREAAACHTGGTGRNLTLQGLSHFQSTHLWTHRNPLPFCDILSFNDFYIDLVIYTKLHCALLKL